MALLMVLCLAAVPLQGAVAAPSAAVSGQVLEDGTGIPIAGAHVMLMLMRSRPGPPPAGFPDQPPTAITDADGRYEFDHLEPGRYRITVQKAGFASLSGPGVPVVTLKSGERRDDLNATLQKGAVIVGRVVDDAGEPLADARVMAMQKPTVPSNATYRPRDVLMPAGSGAQTNDLGEFRVFGLTPGEYYVQAMPRADFGGQVSPRGKTMLVTFFPGTSDPQAAQPISLSAGQTSGDLLIRMIAAAAFQVSGVVLDEAGRPVVNGMVRLMTDEATAQPMFMMGRWNQSRTDISGKFTINNVTNGAYTLLAIAPVLISGPPDSRGGRADVMAGSATSFGVSGGIVGGGGGVMTETSNGTTIEYRDDTATRVPITVNEANVGGLEVTVRRPPR